ncbi:MAG: DUF4344 domain-containing metallopeptidase [Roseobacter sp.]
MRLISSLLTVAAIFPITPAYSQDGDYKNAFVEANILSIFYHELGHAIIDLMNVPIFGQEEDAADVMSVLLIDWLYNEEDAQAIAYDSAFGYLNDPNQTEEVPYWDLHGPDEQRFFNHICVFFGANPEEREDLADDLGLPDERAETCPDEYDQANNSWGAIFDEMENHTESVSMVFKAGRALDEHIAVQLLEDEVRHMNEDLKLPQKVTVEVVDCGEANAFYDPESVTITFCSEFVGHLEEIYDVLFPR